MRDSKARLFVLGTAAVLVFLALAVSADPIGDGALAPYRAGWFSNGGTMTCAATCKAKAPGTLAEYEPSAVPPTKRAFVCRVAGKPVNNLQTWLYGSQFDDRAACYTTGLDLKGSYTKTYFCLCVAK
ncbi:MAG TPA: hypothetical protein VGX68_05160 [Thermoanaerobaculia bacterium]|jgi:hypothetical protein|nr:hypothetical protein [Thermoanaerobaculia bacterium]